MASNERTNNNSSSNSSNTRMNATSRRQATNRKLIDGEREDDDDEMAGPNQESSDKTGEAFRKPLDGTMRVDGGRHWPRASRCAPLSAEQHKSQSHEIDLASDESKRGARVGPMGIFFKVWSLVKVTKARHNNNQRTRRQTSEDTGQFQFISGDQLGATSGASTSGAPAATSALMSSGPAVRQMALRDSHFRRAGSQPPASSGSSFAPSRLQVIDTTTGQQQQQQQLQQAPVSTTSSTSSSGVSSSTSSTLAAAAAAAEKQKNPKKPRAELYRLRRAAESTQSFAELSQRQSRAQVNQSEESDLNGEDDIYSTPNDSIQSVPSSQLGELNGGGGGAPDVARRQRRASSHQLGGGPAAIVKSLSTQNFAHQLKKSRAPARRQSSETQDNCIEKSARASVSTSSSSSTSKTTTTQINGSRFFISSSSSSEDSNNPPPVQTAPPVVQSTSSVQQSSNSRAAQLEQRVPVHFALHQHRPHPPDSLLLLNGGGGGAPVNLLTPTGSGNCQLIQRQHLTSGYKKSPSLFEMSSSRARFSSKYPSQATPPTPPTTQMSTFLGQRPPYLRQVNPQQQPPQPRPRLPNSSSMHECKLVSSAQVEEVADDETGSDLGDDQVSASEYKLARILLQLGANPTAKDQSDGSTALMLAIRSENLSAIKCLIEHGVDLNERNRAGLSALDLICSRQATSARLEMFKLLIDERADFDSTRPSDNSRLLDRLIAAHAPETMNKLPFIEMLLHNGAKLGSSTWAAASGKLEIQLRLLKKLCQDGYFIYKSSVPNNECYDQNRAIRGKLVLTRTLQQNSTRVESAIYRFEYALRRVSQLEQQLFGCDHRARELAPSSAQIQTIQQLKYQVYLGLSRCERKRRFFKRALEYANMTILIDSTSYEGYYSKAHILKDIGELDDALITIDQTDRLVQKSIDYLRLELSELQQQEESLVFDKCFQVHDPQKSNWIEASRVELASNLDYLVEARKYINRLRGEILDDKKSLVAESPIDK